jgi:hypothetical protein
VADVLAFLVLLVAFGAVLGALTWLAVRVRRRGAGGAVMAAVDDVFRPTAKDSYHEIRTQDERRPPQSAPDGA